MKGSVLFRNKGGLGQLEQQGALVLTQDMDPCQDGNAMILRLDKITYFDPLIKFPLPIQMATGLVI